jgi:hypothetical protein
MIMMEIENFTPNFKLLTELESPGKPRFLFRECGGWEGEKPGSLSKSSEH